MKKMLLLFSHKITSEQREEAKKELEVEEFISLPKKLQESWSNVKYGEENNIQLEKIKNFINDNISENDIVLVQGEYGYTVEIVIFLKNKNIKAFYSTTKRESKDIEENGKIKKISFFKHLIFKEY